jgi:diaminopimelate epimerase
VLNNVNLSWTGCGLCHDIFFIFGNLIHIRLKLTFYKYQGAGNDFILVDNREGHFRAEAKAIARMCDRRFGAGADGLILLNAEAGYDFGMKYFNSDGKESTMCGNGGRCIVAFADFLSHAGQEYRFLAVDGEHTGRILGRDGNHYKIILSMMDVPVCRKKDEDYILDTGSPHLVRFVGDVNDVDIVREGRTIRSMAEFQPGGINANFVHYDGARLVVRTYERGVEDETLSCGTGVTASALAYAVNMNTGQGIIPVDTKGGRLAVHFKKNNGGFTGIFLEGPAVQVFDGVMELDDLYY